jgi:hypothetical protein
LIPSHADHAVDSATDAAADPESGALVERAEAAIIARFVPV